MLAIENLSEIKLPSLPRNALRIIELVNDPDVDLNILGKTIEMDPGLATKLVKLSNSSMFGTSRSISSLKQALMILGLRTVKLTALSFTLIKAFPTTVGEESFKLCWQRVMANAMGARIAAKMFELDAEECFLSGMMQDLASLVLFQQCPKEYAGLLDAWRQEGAKPIHELEIEAFGINHAEFGVKLLEHWSMPEVLVQAVGRHHQIDLIDAMKNDRRNLATILAMVECITNFLVNPTVSNFEAFNLVSQAYEESGAQTDKFLQQLEQQVLEMSELLDLKMAPGFSADETLKKARQIAESLETMDKALGKEMVSCEVDAQSGLPTRAALNGKIRQELAMARRQKWAVSLLLIKVDQIARLETEGRIDDSLALIREMGTLLKKTTRDSDTICRFDSDQFFIMCPNTGPEGVHTMMRRLLPAVGSVPVPGEPGNATAHYGIVTVNVSENVVDDQTVLLQLAKNLQGAPARKGVCFSQF